MDVAKRKSKKVVRGFEANAKKIAKRQGVSMEAARAILAKSTRGASAAAKKANPRLKRVKGKPKRRSGKR